MAIMRQQANFVEQLYSSGMVDEQEQEQLLEPIQAQERKLQRNGAVWRAPKIVEVLICHWIVCVSRESCSRVLCF